ncbi:MAG: Exopolyphosphatase-related protein, partial [uncultured Solirubrobacteraceae bacterium]
GHDRDPSPTRHTLRLRRARLRRAAQEARDARGHPLRPPQGHAGRQDRGPSDGHHHEPPVRPRRAPRLRPSRLRGGAGRRGQPREPCDRPERPLRRARRVRPLRRRRGLRRCPVVLAALRGRQGRLRRLLAGRDPRADRLDPPVVPHGPAHRPRPLPRVPHLELPADDAAHRPGHRDVGRRDPRPPGRRRARRAVRRARPPGRPADPRLLARRGRCRGARPPRGGGHPPDQPLHDLRPAPPVPRLGPLPVGPQAAEHGLRRRQVDRRPHVAGRRRRADARVRRRRPRGGRHVPGVQRRGRGGPAADRRAATDEVL